VTTADTPKLSAAQARKLERAEVKAAQLEAQLEEAKARRDTLRRRYKSRLQPSTEKRDRGKNVLQAIAGGILVRVSSFRGGDYFSLKDYREAGHEVTPAMRPFIRPGDPRERWTVKSLAGPKTSGAVEPS
jgi:hypothetical protein